MPWDFEFLPDAPWKRRRRIEQLGLRVLVVMSEHPLARLIEVFLGRQGFAVEVTRSAPEAMEAIAARLPNVLILDADLPAAQAVLATLRGLPEGDTIYVILVVRRELRDEVRSGWGCWANAILSKPLNPMELSVYLRNAWDRWPEARPGAGLLRPADAPSEATLLRPAQASQETPEEQLLRPADGKDAG